MPRRNDWVVVMICGMLLVALSMGIRQSFGVFLRPISTDLGMGRDVFSLALAIQNLCFGLALPFVGMIADRFGSRLIVLAGGLLYATGLLLFTMVSTPLAIYATLGVLVGLGQSATTFVVVFGALGRLVSPERRSLAFGLVTAGGSFGMFAMVPIAQLLISQFAWRQSFWILATLALGLALLALGMISRPQNASTAGSEQTLSMALREARGHTGYWLLNAGFFVCGFHIAFIASHYPAYLADFSISPQVAANALALIGLANVLGSYLFAALGGKYRKKYVLSLIYLGRAVVFVGFLALPLSPLTALAFGAAIGLLWLATVPLTSGLVGQIFGVRYLATLYGIVFLSHQLGAFLGAWLGGVEYDRSGSYNNVWFAAVMLSLTAALLHWFILDRPLRQATSPAVASAS